MHIDTTEILNKIYQPSISLKYVFHLAHYRIYVYLLYFQYESKIIFGL